MLSEHAYLRNLLKVMPTRRAQEDFVFTTVPPLMIAYAKTGQAPMEYEPGLVGKRHAGFALAVNVFKGQRLILAHITKKMSVPEVCRYITKQLKERTKLAISLNESGLAAMSIVKVTYVMDGSTRRFIVHYDASFL